MVNEVLNCDCMEYIKDIPDNWFELAIVDPPYRDQNQPTKEMREASKKTNSKRFVKTEILGKKPDYKYLMELSRISVNQIIFGVNNYGMEFKGFIVWVKTNIPETFNMSMAEIASLSENLSTTSKVFYETSNRRGLSIHPTQKPVSLYKWLLQNYAKPGDKILDTHIGSGSIRIACHDMGFDLYGCELDPDYWQAQEERYKNHAAQQELFSTDELFTGESNV